MTSFASMNVIACPTCSAQYGVLQPASINLRNWRKWSDGKAFGDLYHRSAPVRMCAACGGAYLIEAAEVVGNISLDGVSQRRGGTSPRGRNWLTTAIAQVMGKLEHETAAEPEVVPELAPKLSPDELGRALALLSADASPGLEIALRRQHWQTLNDAYREDASSFPGGLAVTNPQQVTGLERMLEVLHQLPAPDWLEIGELFRELGRFDSAQRAFGKAPETQSTVATFLAGLAAEGLSAVARIDQL